MLLKFQPFLYTQMIDANQIWDVPQAIEWVQKLSEFKPLWIEEPTSPDDILGHATIAKALKYNMVYLKQKKWIINDSN